MGRVLHLRGDGRCEDPPRDHAVLGSPHEQVGAGPGYVADGRAVIHCCRRSF